MRGGISRRTFLKITSAGAVVLIVPWTMEGCSDGEGRPRFFTDAERAALDAATARILPTDEDPGAREAHAVDYIEALLTAFEHDPPLIFAGGPFSGRTPQPDSSTGEPSDDFPENAFERFLPLTRVQEIAWRARIYGSASVPGADFNDGVLGPTKGWRDLYREGLQALDAKSRELFDADFVGLVPEQQDEALAQTDFAFTGPLIEHTLEGTFAAPEYGGNPELSSWRWARYDGDSQPLGFSVFDGPAGEYKELPATPVSQANPDEDFAGLQGEVLEFIETLATGLGGRRFP
jgi:hypothetical protein